MKSIAPFFVVLAFALSSSAADRIPNRLIDYDRFLKTAGEIAELREERRVTDEQFLEMSRDADTVILDARSADRFAQLHVEGAVNLPFTEFTADTLAALIPDKATRILIYCNNNFLNEPVAFASKMAATSLNVHTFNSLHTYGYPNVFELGPLLDANKTRLKLVGFLTEE